MEEQYDTPAVVAEELHTNERTLANWRCKKKGPPYVKVGEKVLYPRMRRVEWLNARLVNTSSAA